MRMMMVMVLAACVVLRSARAAEVGPGRLLDSFVTAEAWTPMPAVGVGMKLAAEGGALRIDYDFSKGAGYAVARKRVDLAMPANYRFTYRLRGTGPRNTLEFKLVDPSGDNVWWVNQRNIEFPAEWTPVRHKRRQIGKAWGPGSGELVEARWLEFAVTATGGGVGTVWIDELRFEELPVEEAYRGRPTVSASSSQDGRALVMEEDGRIGWMSAEGDAAPSLTIDFGRAREFGGLSVFFAPVEGGASHLVNYDVEGTEDGVTWRVLASVRGGTGGRDDFRLPEAEARAVRVLARRGGRGETGGRVGIERVVVRDLGFGESNTSMLRVIAAESPRGAWPRAILDEGSFWTITGNGSSESATLVGEDGGVEIGEGAAAIEPLVYEAGGGGAGGRSGGRLWTWADGVGGLSEQSLDGGYLPLPVVRRVMGEIGLTVMVVPGEVKPAGTFDVGGGVWVRYALENRSEREKTLMLALAMRPVLVNPWYQFLNNPGGAAEVKLIDASVPNNLSTPRHVLGSVTPVSRQGVTGFEGGEVGEWIGRGEVPPGKRVEDRRGLGSGCLAYDVKLAPGASWSAVVRIDGNVDEMRGAPLLADAGVAEREWGSVLAATRAAWTQRLGGGLEGWSGAGDRVGLRLPGEDGKRIAETLRANVAYILINRDGPGIQPGSRAYRRTWIRDGSMTAAALLALGREKEVHDFLEWFAPFQYESGKIPCCVDRRGADPVPENDSHGQFISAVSAYVRQTGDLDFARRMYPRVKKTVAYIESIRGERMTPEYATATDPITRAEFGLVPESISHEGYSSKARHSYWDCFFTLKGLGDAAWLAGQVGEQSTAMRYAALRESFRATLHDSIALATRTHGIGYVPGCVELGDFDATSTTVALSPCDGEDAVPAGLLAATFEKAWENFVKRRASGRAWKDYTPYELRQVGAMVRLGQRERAHEMLAWYFEDQHPAGWRHWAEVVWSDPRKAGFIGDMPHTWVGSDFINAAVSMLAYERADGTLVLGAGVPRAWWRAEEGLEVAGLRVGAAEVSYSVSRAGEKVRVEVKSPLGYAGRVVLSLPDGERVVDAVPGVVEVEMGKVK